MLVIKNEPFTISYNRILSSNKLDPYDKVIYLLICQHCYGKKTECIPGEDTLAAEANCGLTRVKKSVKNLIKCGLIKMKRRYGTSNQYSLIPFNTVIKEQFPLSVSRQTSIQIAAKRPLINKSEEIKDIILSSTSEDQSIMIKRYTPIDYRQLKLNQKLHSLSCSYVALCTDDELYTNKKPSKVYFAVRNFFKKKPETELGYLWDYIYTIDQKTLLSMTDFYNAAILYRNKQNQAVKAQETIDNQPTEQYDEISVEEFLEGL